jgi:hypothetical protein
MDAAQLANSTWMVLASTLALSMALGAVLQATHFCTLGAISDVVLMQDTSRLKQWALAAAVAILGFAAMHKLGWIDPQKSMYGSPQLLWLSSVVGGGLFGVGMVLASGCASKNLIRLGAGNLKSLVVLLVMGVVALATLKGLLGVWRVSVLERFYVHAPAQSYVGSWWAAHSQQSVPQASDWPALCTAGPLALWSLQGRSRLKGALLFGGLAVGLAVVAMWWITGVLGHGLEHPDTLEEFFVSTASGRMESFSFTAPVATVLDAFMYFSDGSKRLTVGMVSVCGVVLGAFGRSIWTGSFRWESFVNRADLTRHLMGGALMGMGGVTAMGCTVGQGLSGLSTLSWMSGLTLISIGLSAGLTLSWQLHQMEGQA